MNVYYNQFKINCSKVVVFFQKLCHKSIYNYFLCLFKKCWIFRNVSCNFYLLAKKNHQKNKLWLKNFVIIWMKLWYKILVALCLVTSIFSYWIHKKQSCKKKKQGYDFASFVSSAFFFLIFKRVGLSLTFLDYFDLL